MKLKEIFESIDEPLVLNEALRTDVTRDVDKVFDVFFKPVLQAIYNDDIATLRQLTKPRKISGARFMSYLSTKTMRDAMYKNPVDFFINADGNWYNPIESVIGLSVSSNAIDVILKLGSMRAAEEAVGGQRIRFRRDLSAPKVKASIHHEFAHYLDDTYNERHLERKLRTVMSADMDYSVRKRVLNRGYDDVNVTDMEVEGIIHNVYQLKRAYQSRWDKLSFEEFVALEPSLTTVSNSLSQRELQIWKRKLLERMGREGLVGKNMR